MLQLQWLLPVHKLWLMESQFPSSTLTMLKWSGTTIGKLTETPDLTRTTANFQSLITGSEPNNASSPGNAEEPEPVKEEDGALDMTAAMELHCQCKPQVLLQTTDEPLNIYFPWP